LFSPFLSPRTLIFRRRAATDGALYAGVC
jgi:hypothetical protein